mmetsp:Transcript_27789/g.64076  ORF Transcript_27789/g.64076 Transcript_27789/m.64076 type:complete len:224 (-) Transcript_27789:4222-4893(-)
MGCRGGRRGLLLLEASCSGRALGRGLLFATRSRRLVRRVRRHRRPVLLLIHQPLRRARPLDSLECSLRHLSHRLSASRPRLGRQSADGPVCRRRRVQPLGLNLFQPAESAFGLQQCIRLLHHSPLHRTGLAPVLVRERVNTELMLGLKQIHFGVSQEATSGLGDELSELAATGRRLHLAAYPVREGSVSLFEQCMLVEQLDSLFLEMLQDPYLSSGLMRGRHS